MADRFEQPPPDPQRQSAEPEVEPMLFAHETLSPEELQADWDRLRGVGRKPVNASADQPRAGSELLAALWLARLPQKLAWAACIMALLLAGWFTLRPGAIRLHTPATSPLAALSLPRELRVKDGGRRVLLQEPGFALTGDLERGRGGATDELRVYDLRLEWRNPAGELVVFSGELVVTNAPGSPARLTRGSVRGALLRGDLKVGDQPWLPYSQSYTP
jgi:hypothetical protein